MIENEQHTLYVFPGQGSQYQGMGSDLCSEYEVARKIYTQASDVLGYDIAELSFHGPDEKLNLTQYTQPALLTHSIACLEIFKDLTDDRLQPAMTAGHSLGEYSALVAAKALSFESALKLVQKRGELMGAHGEGEMTAFPPGPRYRSPHCRALPLCDCGTQPATTDGHWRSSGRPGAG